LAAANEQLQTLQQTNATLVQQLALGKAQISAQVCWSARNDAVCDGDLWYERMNST